MHYVLVPRNSLYYVHVIDTVWPEGATRATNALSPIRCRTAVPPHHLLLGTEAGPEPLQGEVLYVHCIASGKGVPILTRAPDGDGAGALPPAEVNPPVLPYRHITRRDSREVR